MSHDSANRKGEPPLPVNWTSFGSSTGSCSSGTGTVYQPKNQSFVGFKQSMITPQDEQLMIGMGVPQYLCLDINQSLNRYLCFPPPSLSSILSTIQFLCIAFTASGHRNVSNPSNNC